MKTEGKRDSRTELCRASLPLPIKRKKKLNVISLNLILVLFLSPKMKNSNTKSFEVGIRIPYTTSIPMAISNCALHIIGAQKITVK